MFFILYSTLIHLLSVFYNKNIAIVNRQPDNLFINNNIYMFKFSFSLSFVIFVSALLHRHLARCVKETNLFPPGIMKKKI